ncbi:hypothetical protein JOC86_001217 [Bacillus pakistanensis]|uniref:Endolytic transglycosylase MltG n=1 Tax=Rossellomorea pakistanensis TaxID=992288 RepID=A0ABS2NA17_9BACI|nr:endolytic transglycosylase MltG [Bacillus pakistanensis]MBM7584680.1 hypothetical protein [Bacillus pakistanensis]
MSKQSTRSIAFGLFLAGLILFVYQQFFYEIDAKESIALLEKEGYTVLSEKEAKANEKQIAQLQEQLAQAPKQEEKTEEKTDTKKEPNQKQETVKKEEPKVYQAVLSITSGMNIVQISDKLAASKIIKSSDEMSDYLADKHYAEQIKIGEYEVNSEMTIDQIAKIITKTN